MSTADGDGNLVEALDTVRSDPENLSSWEALEEVAGDAQKFEEVAALYREVLSQALSRSAQETLSERAVAFIEEWYGEDAPELVDILNRVLEISPTSSWAFQRLTVVHTAAARWPELFSLYDRALMSAAGERREALLDEAANVALEFADDSGRAIGYLQQLLPLVPGDEKLAATYEQLLEREERWTDLIRLWADQLTRAPSEQEAFRLRKRTAETYLLQLGEPELALAEVRALVDSDAHGAEAMALVERLADSEDVSVGVRREALSLLSGLYDRAERADDVLRVLRQALELSTEADRAGLHRKIGDALYRAGALSDAQSHFAEVIKLDENAREALVRLRTIASETQGYAQFAEALQQSVGGQIDATVRVSRLMEAAAVKRRELNDVEGATELYQRVVAEPDVEGPTALEAARRLAELLGQGGRAEEQLAALEQLAGSEPEASDRRGVLGRAARLAEQLGEGPRAIALWQQRLGADQKDSEALAALIALLDQESQWESLIETLQLRISGGGAALQRRGDLSRIASIEEHKLQIPERAIESWKRVLEEDSTDLEAIRSLAALLEQVESYQELGSLLFDAAARTAGTVAELYARSGRVQAAFLSDPAGATASFRQALRIDPSYEEARKGCVALLEDPSCLSTAVDSLSLAYSATDEWQHLIDLLEPRLTGAQSGDEQVRILRETASLMEGRGQDKTGALACMRRAMALAPELRDIEGDVLRLAEETGEWQQAVVALRDAVDALGQDAPRSRYLRFWEAKLCEVRLGRLDEALSAYLDVFRVSPARQDAASGVVRCGAGLENYPVMAQCLLSCTTASTELPQEVLSTLESALADDEQWTDFAAALEEALRSENELPSDLARQLEVCLARIHHDRRGDMQACERALRSAVNQDPSHEETLQHLAALQRANPSPDFYQTLRTLAAVVKEPLPVLREAAEAALAHLEDESEQRVILQRVYNEGARLWRNLPELSNEVRETTVWGLERLLERMSAEQEAKARLMLLVDASQLPMEPSDSRGLRRRAAAIALESGDNGRAMVLLRGILDEAPDDAGVLQQLAEVCGREGRLPEMAALRQHELQITTDRERRLALRLDLARIVGEIERQGGRVESLLENLKEAPGHQPSIEALSDVLEAGRRFEELADVLSEQARLLVDRGEPVLAASLLAKTARLSETGLEDVDRAIEAHRRVVELEPDAIASLDALARLHMERDEFALAAPWFERRLSKSRDDQERAELALSLSRALYGAGHESRGDAVLARALQQAPERFDIRERLAERYRSNGRSELLAALLTDAAPYLSDADTVFAYAVEAADLWDEAGRPEASLPILERAAEAAPKERGLRLRYCAALRLSGRYDEAATALTELVASYGRRKNAERAAVHFELAEVYRAQGELERGLEELELATKMDVSNPSILLVLGRVAQEAGDLDRAERAYRALLLLVRRQGAAAAAAATPAEVLFHMAEIAVARGDEARGEEQIRKATEAAVSSEDEARRFAQMAAAAGRSDLALAVIDQRLEKTKSGSEGHFRLSLEAGTLLIDKTERAQDGVRQILDALAKRPWVPQETAAVRPVLKRASASQQLADALQARAGAATDPDDKTAQLLSLGEILEQDLEDLAGAKDVYRETEALGRDSHGALLALSRLAAGTGDRSEELRALQLLVSEGAEAAAPPADALYRVAELTLEEDREVGVSKLQEALAREPRPTLAGQLLRRATNSAATGDSMDLYQSVARASGDAGLLLDYLGKRMQTGACNPGELKEGAELALHNEDTPQARRFYEHAMQLADASAEGLASALWAPMGLAAVAEKEGDIREALRWYDQAAALSEPDAALGLRLRAAELAAAKPEHFDVAVDAYGRLFEERPGDQRVWQPFLELARRAGDEDRFTDVSAQILDGIVSQEARSAVRIERARFLLDREGREPDAADELRAVLDEEPGHEQAAQLLADLFEKTGYDDALADLLGEQLDVAIDKEQLAQIKDLSLRLGELVGKVRRHDAIDVYRKAMNWLPGDRDLAEVLLSCLDDEQDVRERIEVSERLLETDSPEVAASRALTLAEDWKRLEDEAAAQRVLEAGFRSNPSHDGLRQQLEAHYRATEAWQELAEFWAVRARVLQGEESIELFQRAARLYSETLMSPGPAAELLKEAQQQAPDDRSLLTALVQLRAAAGDTEGAISDISAALAAEPSTASDDGSSELERAQLFALRADMRGTVGDEQGVIDDLEQAYSLGGEAFAEGLVTALERRRQEADDESVVRGSTLRLVALSRESGDEMAARTLLRTWVERAPTDRPALLTLREMDEAAERYDDLGDTLSRLIELEEGDAQVELVLALVDAYEKGGVPERARTALETVHAAQPQDPALTRKLMTLYEQIGANKELGTLLLQGLEAAADDEERYRLLRLAGDHFLKAGDPEAAMGPLREAHDLRGDDHDATLLLVDCYVDAERYPEAGQLLETAIANHPRRRSPELAELKQRMAKLARVSAGDRVLEMQWLSDALESDKSNGSIAAALAELAMELQEWEVADRTLRIVAMNKSEGPMTRAEAFLNQARIAHVRGEERRALLLARKARSEDSELEAAQEFLRQIAEQ